MSDGHFGEVVQRILDDRLANERKQAAQQARLEKQVDNLLTSLVSLGWEPGLTRESYERVCQSDIRGDNLPLAAILLEIALHCQPITLRGLFYRAVSAGLFPSTDREYYERVGRLVSRLRKLRLMPYKWIVDSLRSTVKPSSWSGLGDFADTVREAYRKDFWSHLDDYVHVFTEKDAIAGTISPVCQEYDVALSPVRGYCSDSFAYEIGSQWAKIEKPIHAFYLGDFDPSGFDIERDLQAKLAQHSGQTFTWVRLGIVACDFDEHSLIPLAPKKSDKRYQKFVAEHGRSCAEIDALDPVELRRRVEASITQFIPTDRWERLQRTEQLERETFNQVLQAIGQEGEE